MLTMLCRFAARLTRKVGVAVFTVTLGLAAYAGWLMIHDHADFGARRRAQLQELADQQTRLQSALAANQQRMERLSAERATQLERQRTAEHAIKALRADDSWWRTAWGRLLGESEKMRTKEERLARLEQLQADAARRAAELNQNVTRATWERDGIEISLDRLKQKIAFLEQDRSKALHYAKLAWLRARWYAVAALILWFLGPLWWRRAWRRRRTRRAEPIRR